MEERTIAVIGATGSQGKGIVGALVNHGAFQVRAVTRNPESYSGQAHEAVKADLNATDSLWGRIPKSESIWQNRRPRSNSYPSTNGYSKELER